MYCCAEHQKADTAHKPHCVAQLAENQRRAREPLRLGSSRDGPSMTPLWWRDARLPCRFAVGEKVEVHMGSMSASGYVPGKILRVYYQEAGLVGCCAAYQVQLTDHKVGGSSNSVMPGVDTLEWIRPRPGKPPREGVTLELDQRSCSGLRRLLSYDVAGPRECGIDASEAARLLYYGLACPQHAEALLEEETSMLLRLTGAGSPHERLVSAGAMISARANTCTCILRSHGRDELTYAHHT